MLMHKFVLADATKPRWQTQLVLQEAEFYVACNMEILHLYIYLDYLLFVF